jgi:myotubularin-related protein 6/7/8
VVRQIANEVATAGPLEDDVPGQMVTEQLLGSSDVPPSTATTVQHSTGWNTYNPRTEFARQGVGSRSRAWRFSDINKDYTYSPTYPAKLVVPSRISDSVLTYAGKYRSKGRIPVLTYLHWANQVSILDASSSPSDDL